MRYRLSTPAQADLDDIRTFTLERWGGAQWLDHYRDLALTFERIAREPKTGRSRDAFRTGLRSVPCRAHIVFYLELAGDTIGIVRILHQRQNAEALSWADEM